MAEAKRKAQVQEERRHFDEALPKVIEQILGTRLDETSDAVEHLKRVNISNLFCFCLKIESQNKKVQQKRNSSRFPYCFTSTKILTRSRQSTYQVLVSELHVFYLSGMITCGRNVKPMPTPLDAS
jgi:hypothetical protein